MKKITNILLHSIALGTVGCLHYCYNFKCNSRIKFESDDSI